MRCNRLSVCASLLLLTGLLVLTACQKKSIVAPDITFQLIDGRKIVLAERRGKPTLIVFWATTCRSCLKEIPHLIQLYQQYKLRGLEIIAVAMPYDRPDYVLAMQKDKAIPYPVALDLRGDAVKAFGNVIVTPNSFLVDPAGKIVKHHIGLWDMNILISLIDAMLINKG